MGKPQSLLYLIRAFVDERQMFRAGHKERRKRLTVITRFRGAANRKERRNWKAAGEQGHGPAGSDSFFLSLSPGFVSEPYRKQTLSCGDNGETASPHPPSFPQSAVSFAISRHRRFRRCLLTKTLPLWRRFPFLSLVSANGMTVSYR